MTKPGTKNALNCPRCGQNAGSAWHWILPKASGTCGSCGTTLYADNSTRGRQFIGLIFALMASLMALGLMLGGDQWLPRTVIGVVFYLSFNLWSVRRVKLETRSTS